MSEKAKKNWFLRHPIFTIVLVLFFVISFVSSWNSLSEEKRSIQTIKEPNKELVVKTEADRWRKIEDNIKEAGNYSVFITDKNGKFTADSSIEPPYEILVTSDLNKYNSCIEAKDSLLKVMKAIYSDEDTKTKISRVKFTAPKYLKASLGYNDAKDLVWGDIGPSMLWSTLLKYKSHEDESRSLLDRTWGEKISECN